MRLRRLDDRTPGMLLATPTRWIAGEGRDAPGDGDGLSAAPDALGSVPALAGGEGLVLLLEGGADEALLVSAPDACRVPRGREQDLLQRAAARARHERMRMHKRQRLPDQLIAYFEELNAAETVDAVFRALATHALAIVGAHTAVALVRDAERGLLRAPARPGAPPGEYRPCVLWDERLAAAGLVLAPDARAGGSFLTLAPLFGDPQTTLIAHVPVGGEGVLVLTERREERIFEPEDWDVLRALALQADMALKRIRLIENVRSLSLTDSLTGLANRRHMEVVLEHAWAAARRGDPLAVVVMDLDEFKDVNDRQGHQAGDRLLCVVADALRAEARGADVVVRFGGDEFLVILPGGTAAGARALATRVRRRLAGRVGVSAGAAEYHAEVASPDELIREADRALYEAKRSRAQADPPPPG